MTRHTLIRTIYLYLFALLGLVLMTIGTVNLIDMGLKAFIFTAADEEQRIGYLQPPAPSPTRYERPNGDTSLVALTAEERAMFQQWRRDYKDWEERRSRIDPVTAHRHREAAMSLAFLIVGLPLYLYHWRTIRKESRERREEREEGSDR